MPDCQDTVLLVGYPINVELGLVRFRTVGVRSGRAAPLQRIHIRDNDDAAELAIVVEDSGLLPDDVLGKRDRCPSFGSLSISSIRY